MVTMMHLYGHNECTIVVTMNVVTPELMARSVLLPDNTGGAGAFGRYSDLQGKRVLVRAPHARICASIMLHSLLL